jgi:hypothetical protein
VATSPEKITAEDLANKDKGVVVTVSGLEAGDKISDSLTGEAGVAEGDTFEYNIYSTQSAEDGSRTARSTSPSRSPATAKRRHMTD